MEFTSTFWNRQKWRLRLGLTARTTIEASNGSARTWQNGTTLVETYSWERMEGTLSKKLAEKLGAVGVTIRRVSNEELRKQFEINRWVDDLSL